MEVNLIKHYINWPMKSWAILKLIETVYILWQQNINAWISAWTALWLYRDWKLIDWDTDIDFGIMWWQELKLPPKYELARTIDFEGRPMQRLYLYDWIPIDFFYYYPEWDKLVNYNDCWKITKTAEYINWIIPKLPEYLEERYKDWKTPTYYKSIYTNDTKNVWTL